MDIKYIFRKPKFPVIINLDGHVIAATQRNLPAQLNQIDLTLKTCHETIDKSGEGFGLYVYDDCLALSPLVVKKRWTKLELIRLYNNRKNKVNEKIYSENSLSSKRFDKIFSDINSLLKET